MPVTAQVFVRTSHGRVAASFIHTRLIQDQEELMFTVESTRLKSEDRMKYHTRLIQDQDELMFTVESTRSKSENRMK